MAFHMTLLTNNLCRMIKSLDERKTRRKENAFKAEGTKCVLDTIESFSLRYLFAVREWIESHSEISAGINGVVKPMECSRQDMKKMSSLTTPTDVIAIYDIPDYRFKANAAVDNLVIALDTIQDPGNLGTIIRVADWFGVKDIICSTGTADCFSPKVIQATMGSISRIRIHYGDLPMLIKTSNATDVYGTFLDGHSISDVELNPTGVIIIGNEGNGISDVVAQHVTNRILIPSYPPGSPTGESLNAAVATAITLAKFRGL